MSMNSFHSRSARPAPSKAHKEAKPHVRKGVRADVQLVEQGLAASRSEAQGLIELGLVHGPAGPITKPAQELPPGTALQLQEDRGNP